VGARANISLSYRSTVFSTEDMEAFGCRFRNHFEQLKQPS